MAKYLEMSAQVTVKAPGTLGDKKPTTQPTEEKSTNKEA